MSPKKFLFGVILTLYCYFSVFSYLLPLQDPVMLSQILLCWKDFWILGMTLLTPVRTSTNMPVADGKANSQVEPEKNH